MSGLNPARLAAWEAKGRAGHEIVERRAFTIMQFCQAYNVGRTKTYEEVEAGRLASYLVGRRRFISAAAAERWQASLEASSQQQSEAA